MPSLKVGDKQRETLTLFGKLVEERPGVMSAVLSRLAPCSPNKAIKALSTEFGIDVRSAADIVEMLIAFAPIEAGEAALSHILLTFSGMVKESDIKMPDAEVLKQELIGLIATTAPVGRIAKAATLINRVERLYLDSDITSDIRPVFGDDRSVSPEAAVLLHRLRIEYRKGTETQEFFVDLESGDLSRLQAVVAQAVAKDNALRNFASERHLRVYE